MREVLISALYGDLHEGPSCSSTICMMLRNPWQPRSSMAIFLLFVFVARVETGLGATPAAVYPPFTTRLYRILRDVIIQKHDSRT